MGKTGVMSIYIDTKGIQTAGQIARHPVQRRRRKTNISTLLTNAFFTTDLLVSVIRYGIDEVSLSKMSDIFSSHI